MITLSTLLLLAAFILFAIEAWRSKSLVSAGLGCWVLSLLIGGLVIR